MGGHVALREERKGAYGILMGRSEEKKQLGRPRCKCEDNIKMCLHEVGREVWTGLLWLL
jgi:hypothetical protein